MFGSRKPAQVIGRLHRDERRLFHDRLRQLDRKVLAGVSKISWAATKGTLDAYCTEAIRYLFGNLLLSQD